MLSEVDLITALNQAASLAEGSRWKRLLHQPFLYLGAVAFRHLVYPLWKRPWRKKSRTFFGVEMVVDLPAGMDLFLLGCKTHDSELRLARFFIRFIQPGDKIVDVGAHFGYFSLLAAHLSGPQGAVWSFEPGGATHTLLSINVKTLPHIETHRLLVGAEDGLCDFWEFPTLFSEYNTTRPETVPVPLLRGRKTPLECVRLDSFFSARHTVPRLIKIDVEGAEYEVVRGLEGMFRQGHFPVVAMEFLGGPGHQQATNWMLEQGYRVFIPSSDGQLQACDNWSTWLADTQTDSENFVFVPGA